jgi:hypothetical protein
MRRATLTVLALVALAAPASAAAKTTADFTFQSGGTATQPGVALGLGSPGTYEDFPFTIAPDDTNGEVAVGIKWANPGDDWDLYVYFKPPGGAELEPVANSAQGNTTEEQAIIQAQSGPIEAGEYIIRVQNYLASNPSFDGVTKFTEYPPPNADPKAKLKVPKRSVAGKKVTLNARGSTDSDGRIVRYGFDLDGNGTIETDNGSSPRLKRSFKAGFRHVTVRVVDDKGADAYATATIAVEKKAKRKRRKR